MKFLFFGRPKICESARILLGFLIPNCSDSWPGLEQKNPGLTRLDHRKKKSGMLKIHLAAFQTLTKWHIVYIVYVERIVHWIHGFQVNS